MPLQRDRLTALLTEQALTSVELVIAPPGYGKTTVLRDYAASDSDAVFAALPESADLESFVRAVIAKAVPAALRSVGAVFDGRSGTDLEGHVSQWLTSRLRTFGGTVIVDDFHRAAGDARVARVLTATIAATHGRMRWIVASREAPRFPMGSWIARGWMNLPVSAEDLRFNRDEAVALAASLDIVATADDIEAIVKDTLGWPIGVRLALNLVARKRAPGQTRMQTRDALFALIDDEVWQPLGADLQRLIAAAALMPSPTIRTLAASGFGDARTAMKDVFARVPFVQAIDDEAFSIHDLFREFVAARAQTQNGANDAITNVGAALLVEGNVADGLRLQIAAGRVAEIEETLALHAFDLLETGHRPAVNAALAFLQANDRTDKGVSLAIRGALAVADGSAANAANLFARALERDVPAAMRSEVSRRLARNYFNRGMAAEAVAVLDPLITDTSIALADRLETRAVWAGLAAAAGTVTPAEIKQVIDEVERELSAGRPSAQVRILQVLGHAAYWSGDLAAAERLSQDAALLATDLGMETHAALAYGMLYNVAGLVDRDHKRARSFLHSQAGAAERGSSTSLLVYALRAEYSIVVMNAEVVEAERLEAILTNFSDARSYRDSFGYRYARALFHIARLEFGIAASTLRSIATNTMSPSERAVSEAFCIVLDLVRDNRSTAARAIDRGLLSDAGHDFWGRTEIARAHALRGLAFWSLDRPAQARKSFGFDMTDLPQHDRVLIDAFKSVSELPHPLSNQKDIDAMCVALQQADFTAYSVLLRALVARDLNDVELSAAEIETLRVFDQVGGRAVDVAAALGKSKFTVQNQIQSAIRKLGCSGRAEAIAYARKRGWLDSTSR